MELSKSEIKECLIRQIQEKAKGFSAAEIEKMNLYELHMDSLSIMRIISYWMKQGYRVNFAQFMKQPYVEAWADMIEQAKQRPAKKEEQNTKEKVSAQEPFPLTDVQYAYWIGRRESQYLGGVGCHGYMEVNCKAVQVKVLEEAWNVVQMAHPMLRACYIEDGRQYVMNQPYLTEIQVEDLSVLPQKEQESRLLEKREQLSHRLLKIEQGQVAQIQLTKCAENHYVMHFDIDLLVCDVLSFKIILRDLAAYYMNRKMPPADKNWNFAQYLKDTQKSGEAARRQAKKFWQKKIETMPDGPRLPLNPQAETIKYPRFTRRSHHFSEAIWNSLKEIGSQQEITAAMLLLTAYARTIAKWSESKEFILNLPIFNRDVSAGIDEVVADFTGLVLVEMDFREQRSFLEDAKIIQKHFLENADNIAYSGIQVLRDLQKLHGSDAKAPVVFSCNLGEPLLTDTFVQAFGELDYMISQTPQVWIDFQAYDENQGLTVLWDGIDELFPKGLVDEMFGYFRQELNAAAKQENTAKNRMLSEGERRRLREIEQAAFLKVKEETIHLGILRMAETCGEKIALKNVDNGVSFTYADLAQNARKIAAGLQKKADSQDLIALFLPRGERQVLAALGVLTAGMAYVPIHLNQPESRLQQMVKNERITHVITEKECRHLLPVPEEKILYYDDLVAEQPLTALREVKGSDTAYIIFTSGTTGVPKGVEITHESAMNTLREVNRICAVTEKDVLLNVSSYDFDLSVYDFFGSLQAGAALLVVNQESWRDAKRWAQIAAEEKVTLWNSVPTLFKMYLMEAEEGGGIAKSLRYVMLSGDWIDLDIPKRLYAQNQQARILAMGGATEASIWSNQQEIYEKVPEHWISIPYGKALPNQYYRIVDDAGYDCPSHVVGELWIGGAGVAKGYLGDAVLTKEKFVEDAYGRWYRTGDLGRFWSDDTIEFLGRRDRQIKLRGHRIELGEIENAINRLPEVDKSYVDLMKENQTSALVAYVKLNSNAANRFAEPASHLKNVKISANLAERVFDEDAKQSVEHMLKVYEAFTVGCIRKWLPRFSEERITEAYQNLWTQWKTLAEQSVEQGDIPLNSPLADYIKPFDKNMEGLLYGELDAKDLVLDEQFVETEKIVSENAQGKLMHKIIRQVLQQLASQKTAPLRVLEIGSERIQESSCYREILKPDSYTVAAESAYYLQKAEQAHTAGLDFTVFRGDESVLEVRKGYDFILANQTLHRAENIDVLLCRLKAMLRQGGKLLLTEGTALPSLTMISTVFLKKNYTDWREGTDKMLCTREEWKEAAIRSGFRIAWELYDDNQCGGIVSLLLENPGVHLYSEDSKYIQNETEKKLPAYMIPKYVMYLQELPITKNGKVDRKALQKLFAEKNLPTNQPEQIQLQTETEKALAEIWKNLLKTEVNRTDHYFMLGGDSLLATALRNEIKKKFSVEYSLEDIFLKPVLFEMAEKINQDFASAKQTPKEKREWTVVKDSAPYEPFPLTQMQQSYLIGRSGAFELGSYSSHCYFEMDTERLDTQRLQAAWNQLIQLHPMMRAVICEDNMTQRILKQVPKYQMKNMKLSGSTQEVEESLQKIRAEMEHQIFNPYVWPAYDIRYAALPEEKGRIFISFDNIFFDGWSMFYLFRQWKKLYENSNWEAGNGDLSFKEYVLSIQANVNTEEYEADLSYWKEKADTIYPAPEFDVKMEEQQQSFVRYQTQLTAEQWNTLKKKIKSHGMTEPAFLMSLYGEVIAHYSRHQKFSLNLTRFNRLPVTEHVNEIVGDFTTLTILSLDFTKGETFAKRAEQVQQTLWAELSHSNVSGIEVERMLNQNQTSKVTMPVVFTSGIGLTSGKTVEDDAAYLGKLGYGLSQTPQVWMDMQVYDDETGLVVSIDAVENIFPAGMIKNLFADYEKLLKRFVNEDTLWNQKHKNLVVSENIEMIRQMNKTTRENHGATLVSLFENSVRNTPNHPAIICGDSVFTYRQTAERAGNIAAALRKDGFERQTPVAIMMKKGAEQLFAALGIMMAGGIYLPLNLYHPIIRNQNILHKAGVRFLVTDASYPDYEQSFRCIPAAVSAVQEAEEPKMPKPEELAYIIYTSGTTGEPKGVAITHAGAVNTILDVNERIQANSQDRTLALSQMNFDLSVYDVFGMFAAGGAVVVPKEELEIEPSYWQELVQKHQITVWNSVPSYMQMYLSYLEEQHRNPTEEIHHVLLSGDWIPVDMGQRAKQVLPCAKLYGLGGATEASIWSNWYEITEKDKNRKSIPYGRPLANQSMYILNDTLSLVPNDVAGDLYIGGEGLASCYWKDEERTNASFIVHPEWNIRLYRTGDLAMYSAENQIIFLGREDGQVKLNGYRIEIGEIEAAVKRVTGEAINAVVFSGQKLHACLKNAAQSADEIKEQLAAYLPAYMIPQYIHFIEDMPLNANGKLDRKALQQLCEQKESHEDKEAVFTEKEKQIAEIWKNILKATEIYANDDFFQLGGDSLKAVQVANNMKQVFHIDMPISAIFEYPTVQKLAAWLTEADDLSEEGEI